MQRYLAFSVPGRLLGNGNHTTLCHLVTGSEHYTLHILITMTASLDAQNKT